MPDTKPTPPKPGTRPDNTLPSGGTPDNTLPPGVDNTLPPGSPGSPDNTLPPGVDNTLPPGSPGRPDNTLPSGGRPDNSLPGSGGRPDNTLPKPGRPGRPDNSLPDDGKDGDIDGVHGEFFVSDNVAMAGLEAFRINYSGVASKEVIKAIYAAMKKAEQEEGECDDSDEADTLPA